MISRECLDHSSLRWSVPRLVKPVKPISAGKEADPGLKASQARWVDARSGNRLGR